MAGLNETAKWEREVYQIEEDDPVLGGVEGVTNKPLKHLANRTLYLKQVLEAAGQKLMPKKLTATTRNTADNTGHTHEIDLASTTTKGLVQLTNDTGLDSEVLALTAKAGKAIAQSVAQLQLSTTNALNQKVNKTDISNAVNSTSQTTVASSQAVKTAYDLANSKYTAQDASSTQKGLVQLANNLTTDDATKALTAAQGVAIKRRLDKFIINNNCQDDADTLVVDGIYSYGSGDMSNKNLPTNHNYYVQVISGDSPGWHRQVAMRAYSGDRYERYKLSFNGNWSPWKRADIGGLFGRFDSPNINLNDFKSDGVFSIGLATSRPIAHSGMLFVLSGGVEGRTGTLQRYTLHNRQECYERWFDASTNSWSNWARVDGAEWSALRNKPTTVDGFGITDAVKKTGDTMTGPLNINHVTSYLRGKNNGVDDWLVGRVRNNDNDVALVSYKHNTGVNLKADRVESNKDLFVGNKKVFHEGNLLPIQQVSMRANIGNTQTAYQDATPEQLPEGSFVGLSTKAGLDGSAKNGWMMINRNWPDNAGSYAFNRIGISGDRMRFQTANNLNAWGDTIELVNLSDFVYQKIGNFEIRKYPDGTMIQTCLHRNGGREYNRNINENTDVVTLVYPISFIEMPAVSVTPQLSHPYFDTDNGLIATNDKSKRLGSPIFESNNGALGLSVDNNKSQCQFVYGNGDVYISEMTFHIMAIGRWK
ncbi:tail fiber protein [Glaesserella parasuis]|nr:tail fiber protein [Glaesserella parasuis]